MNCAIEGVYRNGAVELSETPPFHEPVSVLVVFLNKQKRIAKLGGLCKGAAVDYVQLERDLNELQRGAAEHLLAEFDDHDDHE
jgi:hypothetical protein